MRPTALIGVSGAAAGTAPEPVGSAASRKPITNIFVVFIVLCAFIVVVIR
jgi:hypothetical protein